MAGCPAPLPQGCEHRSNVSRIDSIAIHDQVGGRRELLVRAGQPLLRRGQPARVGIVQGDRVAGEYRDTAVPGLLGGRQERPKSALRAGEPGNRIDGSEQASSQSAPLAASNAGEPRRRRGRARSSRQGGETYDDGLAWHRILFGQVEVAVEDPGHRVARHVLESRVDQ